MPARGDAERGALEAEERVGERRAVQRVLDELRRAGDRILADLDHPRHGALDELAVVGAVPPVSL